MLDDIGRYLRLRWYEMKRPARWAVPALLAATLAGCAHFPSLPVRGEIAGRVVETTVDSEAARYYLVHYLRGDRRHAALDTAFDALHAEIDEALPTRARLKTLSEQYSPDFAALYFLWRLERHEPSRRLRATFGRELARLRAGGIQSDPRFAAYRVLFVPGWDYTRSSVLTGADFALQRRLLAAAGLDNRLAEIPPHGAVEDNAAAVAREIQRERGGGKRLIVVSTSSAGPAVALALGGLLPAVETTHVRAWLNVGGILHGTPVADRHLAFPLSLLARPYAWIAGWPWEAVESMSTARSRERFARLRLPPHLLTVNYFGAPLSGQVTPLALDNYLAMRREGPNDGLTPLADTLVPGSPSLAELGRDHFLAEDPEIGLKTLALAHTLMDYLERPVR